MWVKGDHMLETITLLKKHFLNLKGLQDTLVKNSNQAVVMNGCSKVYPNYLFKFLTWREYSNP